MIKARAAQHVILGLSRMNVERLMQDMPIRFDGAEVGVPGITFVIVGGETEQAIEADLRRVGAVTDETVVIDRLTGKGNH